MIRQNYTNGYREGKYESWYENGVLCRLEHYRNGKLHGERKVWDESGSRIVHEYFRHGNKVHKEQFFEDD